MDHGAEYLVGYRDGDGGRLRYYRHMMDGRPIAGAKKEAPRFPLADAQTIARQLVTFRGVGWQVVKDEARCKFQDGAHNEQREGKQDAAGQAGPAVVPLTETLPPT